MCLWLLDQEKEKTKMKAKKVMVCVLVLVLGGCKATEYSAKAAHQIEHYQKFATEKELNAYLAEANMLQVPECAPSSTSKPSRTSASTRRSNPGQECVP